MHAGVLLGGGIGVVGGQRQWVETTAFKKQKEKQKRK